MLAHDCHSLFANDERGRGRSIPYVVLIRIRWVVLRYDCSHGSRKDTSCLRMTVIRYSRMTKEEEEEIVIR
jgi:hypothetical protein